MTCNNPKCARELPDGAVWCCWCGRKQIREKRRRTRANGQGCVSKLPNGSWKAEKTLGYKVDPLPPDAPPDAKPHKRRIVVSRCFKTRTEALAALPFLTAADRRPINSTMTARKGERIRLKELYDQWEPTHDKGKSTMNCYRSGFKLFAPLWFVPMADLDIDDLQDCLDDSELGKRTKENAKTVLGLVYKYGIPRNCVPKDRNLAQFLKINAEGGTGKSGFSADELEAVREAAEAGDRTAQLVLCHCYLGFRPTALLALTVGDYSPKERAFVGGIKTEAGKGRTVTVSPRIQPYVDAFLTGRADGPAFPAPGGGPYSLADYRTDFYALLDHLGIPNPIDEQGRHRLTPHSCRHTFATLMKRVQGADADKLALIGHTSTAQLREYQDVSYEDLRKITDQI